MKLQIDIWGENTRRLYKKWDHRWDIDKDYKKTCVRIDMTQMEWQNAFLNISKGKIWHIDDKPT